MSDAVVVSPVRVATSATKDAVSNQSTSCGTVLKSLPVYWGYGFGVSLPQVKEFWAGADHCVKARIERKRWSRPLAGHEVGNGSDNNYGEDPQDRDLLFDQQLHPPFHPEGCRSAIRSFAWPHRSSNHQRRNVAAAPGAGWNAGSIEVSKELCARGRGPRNRNAPQPHAPDPGTGSKRPYLRR